VRDVNEARDNLGIELYYEEAAEAETAASASGDVVAEGWAPNLLMMAIAVGSFVGSFALLMWWRVVRHRRPPPLVAEPNDELTGIGGWLILPAIGLVLSPVRMVAEVFTGYGDAFDQTVWTALTTVGSGFTNYALATIILFEVIFNMALIALSLMAVISFFRRDRCAPTLIRGFYVFSLVLICADVVALEAFDLSTPEELSGSFRDIIRHVGIVAIWVPYFTVS
jgi:hypothetical protein